MTKEKLIELLEKLKNLLVSEQKLIKLIVEAKEKEKLYFKNEIDELKKLQLQKKNLLAELKQSPPLSLPNAQIAQLITEIRYLLSNNSLLMRSLTIQ